MEEWVQWTIGTLIALGSLVVAYFSFRKKPEATQKQKVSKNNLQQSPVAQNIHSQVNHFGGDPKPEPVKTAPEEKISERDKKIIRHLFNEVLDLDMAKNTLDEQPTWYGYKQEAIHNLLYFSEEADKLSNRVSNPVVRGMIEDFHEALEEFHRKCSNSVAEYHLKDWYLYIGRQNDFDEERKERELEKSYDIDELGKVAYQKLTELTDILYQKDLL